MIRVIVGAPGGPSGAPDWARRLIGMPDFDVSMVLSTDDAIAAATREQVSSGRRPVVVCAADLDKGHILNVLPVCEELGVGVVAVLSPADAELIHEVMLAGAAAYRIQPGPFEPLVSDIRRVGGLERRRGVRGPQSSRHGNIVTVTSATGGAGKTAVATRLAALVARHQPADSVAMLDLNLSFGAADVAFGVQSERTVTSVLAAAGELEPEDLLRATVATVDGVRFLASPHDLEQAAMVQGSDVTALLDDCRRAFGFTVVDTASYLDDVLVASLRAADLSVLVVTPDVASARNALRLFETARRLGVPRERIGVLVNGVGSGKQVPLPYKELEAAFSGSIIGKLPLVPGLRADCSTGDEHVVGLATAQWRPTMMPLAQEVCRSIGLNLLGGAAPGHHPTLIAHRKSGSLLGRLMPQNASQARGK